MMGEYSISKLIYNCFFENLSIPCLRLAGVWKKFDDLKSFFAQTVLLFHFIRWLKPTAKD